MYRQAPYVKKNEVKPLFRSFVYWQMLNFEFCMRELLNVRGAVWNYYYREFISIIGHVLCMWASSICTYVRGGADNSLARPTARWRRTESIVSLERGVCSCAEFQVVSCYRGWKQACQATRAISTTWRRELSTIFSPLQGKAPKEIHAIMTETLWEHAPS